MITPLSTRSALHWGLIAVSCITVFLLCFLPMRIESEVLNIGTLMDAGHLPLFGVMACAILFSLMIKENGVLQARHFVLAGGLTIFVAGLVEILQPLVDRDPSYLDFVNGAIGAILGLAGVIVFSNRTSLAAKLCYFVALFFGTLLAIGPYLELAKASSARKLSFPLLSDFEDPADLIFWTPLGSSTSEKTEIAQSQTRSFSGDNSLKVSLGRDPWPGIAFYPPELSWRDFSTLHLAIFSDSEELTLTIRIDDQQDCSSLEKRFNKRFALRSGWNKILISTEEIALGPKNRELDLDSIRKILIFGGQNTIGKRFFLDDVRLKK